MSYHSVRAQYAAEEFGADDWSRVCNQERYPQEWKDRQGPDLGHRRLGTLQGYMRGALQEGSGCTYRIRCNKQKII